MIETIAENRLAIAAICRSFGVRRLDIFGSAVQGTFDPDHSDLDFLVDFRERSPGFARRFFAFEQSLEELLGFPVDLTEMQGLTNPFFRHQVNAHREVIFEDRDGEAVA